MSLLKLPVVVRGQVSAPVELVREEGTRDYRGSRKPKKLVKEVVVRKKFERKVRLTPGKNDPGYKPRSQTAGRKGGAKV